MYHIALLVSLVLFGFTCGCQRILAFIFIIFVSLSLRFELRISKFWIIKLFHLSKPESRMWIYYMDLHKWYLWCVMCMRNGHKSVCAMCMCDSMIFRINKFTTKHSGVWSGPQIHLIRLSAHLFFFFVSDSFPTSPTLYAAILLNFMNSSRVNAVFECAKISKFELHTHFFLCGFFFHMHAGFGQWEIIQQSS